MKHTKKILTGILCAMLMAMVAMPASAQPNGAQVFDVYDNTDDGLVVATDPDMGNVEVVANPGGSDRLIVNVHVQKAAPNCELQVELVRASEGSNGGLDETGHIGFIQTLGTLTTNNAGNGNAHFDIQVGDGTLDTAVFGHVDFEDITATCVEADGTGVDVNEYGAAPDPLADTPLTWME
jgi:hypothetical protein